MRSVKVLDISNIDMSNKRVPSEVAFLSLFGRIRRLLNVRATQAFKPFRIGTKQALLLRQMRESGPSTLIELARNTVTDPTSTGKIIESLIKRKWVVKTDHPYDRRSWRVSLTRSGKATVREIDIIWNRLADELTENLKEPERRQMIRGFSKIADSLERKIYKPKDKP